MRSFVTHGHYSHWDMLSMVAIGYYVDAGSWEGALSLGFIWLGVTFWYDDR